MIEQYYPSKHKPKPVLFLPQQQQTHSSANQEWYTADETKQALLRKLTPAEYLRRDNLIRKLSNECPVQVGDTAYPTIEKDYKLYDIVQVVGVARSYKDLELDHVWKNDNPMIVTFHPLKDRQTTVFCTANYLSKRNTFEVVC